MRTLLLLALAASASAQTFTAVPERLPADPGFLIGPAVVDVDANGRVDLIGRDHLFLQRADGFHAVPMPQEYTLGVIAGDADEDGLQDLVLLAGQQPKLVAYDPLRDALGTPMALPIQADIPLVQGSIWLDDDRDGHLDLLIGNDGPPDVLLRGTGGGFFTDVSTAVLPDVAGGTYGMAAADMDKDGDLDVAIGLCFPLPAPNLLYRREAGGFVEVGAATGTADPLASWAVTWLDYDGDSWLDLYSVNMVMGSGTQGSPSRNKLFRNNRDGTFTEVAAEAGVAGASDEDSWSVVAADFDNDGHVDLFVGNDPERPRLYRNRGDGTFEDVLEAAGLGDVDDLGVAAGDVDGDGWVDLFIPHSRLSLPTGLLYLNDGGTNGWLAVRLRGTDSNPDGVGARVEVTAGGRTQVREITAGDGMMAHSHALEAHFGLGTETSADVSVFWPSGEVTTVSGIDASQRVTIVEGEGLNAPPGLFTLDGITAGGSGQPLALSWSAAADDDVVTYTLTVRHENGAERSWTTTATQFVVPAAELPYDGEYTWSVRATDGRSVRLADAPGAFVVGPVAGEAAPERSTLTVSAGPNPVAGRLAVRLGGLRAEAVIEVTDLLGRSAARRTVAGRADGAAEVDLDLTGVPAGVYVLRVASGTDRASLQVTVAE